MQWLVSELLKKSFTGRIGRITSWQPSLFSSVRGRIFVLFWPRGGDMLHGRVKFGVDGGTLPRQISQYRCRGWV